MSQIILRTTQYQRQIVDMALCGMLHSYFNNTVFEAMDPLEFYSAMNLRPDAPTITARSGCVSKLGYMLMKVASETVNKAIAEDWLSAIVGECGMELRSVQTHAKDVEKTKISTKNKKFVEDMNSIIRRFKDFVGDR